MKLYTEEQVRKVLHPDLFHLILPRMTPIELPSDEEIEQRVTTLFGDVGMYQLYDKDRFIDGAKWMREHILGKEDKTFKQKSKWTEVDNMTRRLK